ncbi:hypothetical protein [Halomonas rhizosphaerae]|uniref:Uncharacterized protein n=1 Tax=Halomonas rhizosphaerae TaxID=3043296 RepID=A0ABT6V1Q4_9GAMM|nr:hypothetical protein [Halomonas rhizosphaerae]MDI5892150.1 hypothetical protein [Halomonas rhizosphaerae]MDI5920403.1 hypothetical protein [Halomonas rhizosphaerae]
MLVLTGETDEYLWIAEDHDADVLYNLGEVSTIPRQWRRFSH